MTSKVEIILTKKTIVLCSTLLQYVEVDFSKSKILKSTVEPYDGVLIKVSSGLFSVGLFSNYPSIDLNDKKLHLDEVAIRLYSSTINIALTWNNIIKGYKDNNIVSITYYGIGNVMTCNIFKFPKSSKSTYQLYSGINLPGYVAFQKRSCIADEIWYTMRLLESMSALNISDFDNEKDILLLLGLIIFPLALPENQYKRDITEILYTFPKSEYESVCLAYHHVVCLVTEEWENARLVNFVDKIQQIGKPHARLSNDNKLQLWLYRERYYGVRIFPHIQPVSESQFVLKTPTTEDEGFKPLYIFNIYGWYKVNDEGSWAPLKSYEKSELNVWLVTQYSIPIIQLKDVKKRILKANLSKITLYFMIKTDLDEIKHEIEDWNDETIDIIYIHDQIVVRTGVKIQSWY